MSIKLISLNVALFEANNEKLHAFLSDQNADILCLQEVTNRVDSSAHSEFVSKDAIDEASLELNHSFSAPIWVLSKFEKQQFHGKEHFVFDLGGNVEFGNYTRSRFPIQKGQNIFVQNHFAYVTDWSNWPDEDYRGFQATDVLVEGKPLRLINYHGIWSRDKLGTEKTRKACEIIRDCGFEATGAVIICGDFNLFPATDSIEVLNTEFRNLCNELDVRSTRPGSNELSGATRNVVDYIFVNEKVTVQHFEVLQSDASDHLPLVLEFEME